MRWLPAGGDAGPWWLPAKDGGQRHVGDGDTSGGRQWHEQRAMAQPAARRRPGVAARPHSGASGGRFSGKVPMGGGVLSGRARKFQAVTIPLKLYGEDIFP